MEPDSYWERSRFWPAELLKRTSEFEFYIRVNRDFKWDATKKHLVSVEFTRNKEYYNKNTKTELYKKNIANNQIIFASRDLKNNCHTYFGTHKSGRPILPHEIYPCHAKELMPDLNDKINYELEKQEPTSKKRRHYVLSETENEDDASVSGEGGGMGADSGSSNPDADTDSSDLPIAQLVKRETRAERAARAARAASPTPRCRPWTRTS